jgi:hypothetical protein
MGDRRPKVCGKLQATGWVDCGEARLPVNAKSATCSAKGTIEEIKPVWDFLVTW